MCLLLRALCVSIAPSPLANYAIKLRNSFIVVVGMNPFPLVVYPSKSQSKHSRPVP